MSAKHSDPAYIRNARIIRARVRAAHANGDVVLCWRGRRPIVPGQPYDVGHKNEHGGHDLSNLAPEHRSATPGCCAGNRSHGGALGAAKTNARPIVPQGSVTTWNL